MKIFESLTKGFKISKIIHCIDLIKKLNEFYSYFHGLPKHGNKDLYQIDLVEKFVKKLEKNIRKYFESHEDLKQIKEISLNIQIIFGNWRIISNEALFRLSFEFEFSNSLKDLTDKINIKSSE